MQRYVQNGTDLVKPQTQSALFAVSKVVSDRSKWTWYLASLQWQGEGLLISLTQKGNSEGFKQMGLSPRQNLNHENEYFAMLI